MGSKLLSNNNNYNVYNIERKIIGCWLIETEGIFLSLREKLLDAN